MSCICFLWRSQASNNMTLRVMAGDLSLIFDHPIINQDSFLSWFLWQRVAAKKEATQPLWNICVTNDHGYVPFVVITIRFFPHSRPITGFVTRVTDCPFDIFKLFFSSIKCQGHNWEYLPRTRLFFCWEARFKNI